MTKPTKKISRRDALRILGAAAGASVLASLPSKWSTPELATGVLPAHAQTSALLSALECSPNGNFISVSQVLDSALAGADAIIVPPASGISMHYSIVITPSAGTAGLSSPLSSTGDVTTVSGVAALSIIIQALTYNGADRSQGQVAVTWSFNTAGGSGPCTQLLNYDIQNPTPL